MGFPQSGYGSAGYGDALGAPGIPYHQLGQDFSADPFAQDAIGGDLDTDLDALLFAGSDYGPLGQDGLLESDGFEDLDTLSLLGMDDALGSPLEQDLGLDEPLLPMGLPLGQEPAAAMPDAMTDDEEDGFLVPGLEGLGQAAAADPNEFDPFTNPDAFVDQPQPELFGLDRAAPLGQETMADDNEVEAMTPEAEDEEDAAFAVPGLEGLLLGADLGTSDAGADDGDDDTSFF